MTLEGAGLINIPRADDPQVFTNPASLSYGSLDVTAGAVTRTIIVHITDAGGGSGNWSATIQPQTATPGATISAPDDDRARARRRGRPAGDRAGRCRRRAR